MQWTAGGTLGTPTATRTYTYTGDRRDGTTYDAIGNPLSYTAGSTNYTMTWNGRQLTEINFINQQVYKFTYNSDGIRTTKTVNGTKHTYYLEGSTILAEEWGAHLVIYLYDESGAPIGMQYRNTTYEDERYDTYYFEKNLQGDIIAIYTATGTKIGGYIYDAWGNCTVSVASGVTVMQRNVVYNYNPFRYRGYYYDTQTNLYYLQSRYYDPAMGRFLNADKQISKDVLGKNLYVYCSNNSVSRTDNNGEAWWAVSALVGGIVGGVSQIVCNVANGEEWNSGLLGAVAGGAVYGAIASTGSITLACYASSTVEAVVNEVISYTGLAESNGGTQKTLSKENISNSGENIVLNAVVNGTVNMMTAEMANYLSPIFGNSSSTNTLAGCFVSEYALTSHGQTVVQGFLGALGRSKMPQLARVVWTMSQQMIEIPIYEGK